MNAATHLRNIATSISAILVCVLFPGFAAAQTATLNMVAVGINKYRHPGMDLNYAVADAREVVSTMRSNRLFAKADVNILTDSQATLSGINAAIGLLERRATASSYSILFLSGHGSRDAAGFFLYPAHDFDPRNAAATSIAGNALNARLRRLPGRVFLIIDACHSGSAGIIRTEVANSTKSSQMVILGSSLRQELSQELGSVRNGAFTQAFLEAISGAADLNRDRVVSLTEIHSYVYSRVSKLTSGQQHTITHVPSQAYGKLAMALLPKTAPASGIVWQGRETLKGFGALTFVLQNGGRVIMNDAKGQWSGAWSAKGDIVTLQFASGRVVYTGRMVGNSFTGTAVNQSTRWTFALARK